jgi:hypothetical protein
VLTYDNAAEVLALAARHGFQHRPCHDDHTSPEMNESVISKHLSWVL